MDDVKDACKLVGTEDIVYSNISIAPNPIDDDFLLTISDKVPLESRLEIYDIMGRQVHQQIIYFGTNHVDVVKLCPGSYLYQVSIGTKALKVGKFIKL